MAAASGGIELADKPIADVHMRSKASWLKTSPCCDFVDETGIIH
jgi:hypothetical protein